MLARFDRVVRCGSDHLFTTIWMPLGSLKAVRLGPARWQRCPVGRHWALVRRVDEASLDPDSLATARAVHDLPIP